MSFLLLGIDSLIACIAIGALIEARHRVRLAALSDWPTASGS
jgi:hypothetical protein